MSIRALETEPRSVSDASLETERVRLTSTALTVSILVWFSAFELLVRWGDGLEESGPDLLRPNLHSPSSSTSFALALVLNLLAGCIHDLYATTIG
jgi:hypothetical protein